MTTVTVTPFAVDRLDRPHLPVAPAKLPFQGSEELVAFNSSFATLVLQPSGKVVRANDKFLHSLGYQHEDIESLHIDVLSPPVDGRSTTARREWQTVLSGELRETERLRQHKDGTRRWIQAFYTLVPGADGRITQVVEISWDITERVMRSADDRGQVRAIHASQAVVQFALDGTILEANDIFLDVMGYRLEEIAGRHHRLLMAPGEAEGTAYEAFWARLAAGQHHAGEYRRIGKDGREVWLQANYSPIFDPTGRPIKVVKYAADITRERTLLTDFQWQVTALHKSHGVITFDMHGVILDANDHFLRAVGYRLEDIVGRHHRLFVEPETATSPAYQAFWQTLSRGVHQSGEFRRIGKDGREIWLQAAYNPIMDVSGRPIKVVKYATDITQEKLRQADYQSQITAIEKSQGVMTLSLDGLVLGMNANLLATLGYRLDEIVGRHHRTLMEPGEVETPGYAAFWRTLRSGKFLSGRYKRIGRDGREIWLQASYNPIFDLNGKLDRIMKFAIDITADVAMAEAFEDAKRQAHHDPATALPNRTRLASFLLTHLAIPQAQLAVMYLDLDRFKAINDTHGHQAGDKVLGEVADRLRRSLKPDQIAARIGGDEFVIAAPHLSEADVVSHCQHLLKVVAEPIRHDGHELFVGLSIGVAMAPSDGTSPDELLRAADTALYRSKHDGRGRYCFFSAGVSDRVEGEQRLTEDMRQGIATGEFVLEYQPRFDVLTGSIRSAEALVRWQHPTHGRMAPDLFIPLAERNSLILPLGAWVLQTACRTACDWPGGMGVSVNVSPVQFREGRLVEQVRHALQVTGLAPHRLELELTEGVLLGDTTRAGVTMRELKALGVRLAIDDFGTGYASLSYLRLYAFDVIKIDRQFIRDLDVIPGGRAIVQAILALGKALGLGVTAEGVETQRQLDLLIEDDCLEVQGFLMSRPMAAAQLDKLLETNPAGVRLR